MRFAIREPHVIDERYGAFAVATADEMRNEQLRIGLNRRPGPNVAGAIHGRLHARNVLLLGADERPNFIDLNSARFHVAHLGVMEASAESGQRPQEASKRC